MASFDFNMPDGLKNELEAAANIERIAPKMLEAAAPVVVSAMKKRLSAHDKTGQLSASVKAGKVKYSSKHGGHSMAVNPTGKSSTYIDAKGRLKKRKSLSGIWKSLHRLNLEKADRRLRL